MQEPYNKLSNAQVERLVYLIEECSEVQKAATKILRHGYQGRDPTNPRHISNLYDLETEMQDLFSAIYLLEKNRDINQINLVEEKKLKYMHYQK